MAAVPRSRLAMACGLITFAAACGGPVDPTPAPSAVDITGWQSPAAPTPTTEGSAFPDCPNDELLAAIRDGVPIGGGLTWERVAVLNCAGGFARATAAPENALAGERELVFLRRTDAGWTVLASGTGLYCGDPDLPELAEACRALRLE